MDGRQAMAGHTKFQKKPLVVLDLLLMLQKYIEVFLTAYIYMWHVVVSFCQMFQMRFLHRWILFVSLFGDFLIVQEPDSSTFNNGTWKFWKNTVHGRVPANYLKADSLIPRVPKGFIRPFGGYIARIDCLVGFLFGRMLRNDLDSVWYILTQTIHAFASITYNVSDTRPLCIHTLESFWTCLT